MRKCKYNLVSWTIWKKRENPQIVQTNDGMFKYIFSRIPTLVDNGFCFIGEEEGTQYESDKKTIAERLIDEYLSMSGKAYDSRMEFVYLEHKGSTVNSMPDIVYVYGRVKE